ncbi:LemA family protein [Algoriphagus aestuariicola]|jgi:LemA protein|uniref:LemA family protein n=1 Tax=Algoriphagus aestuariicola TaxID=1852016 RepID=A0ABS3BQ57_9BACT|nr:LemA family protein [Algoriphagus aestuariicola]MBN7801046.1 LemA family protein [Algoriphagus aestuariicola]
MTLLIIGVLVLLLVFYAIGIYNKLVRLRTLVEEAWSGIDVQLKKRYNLIPNLVETVKGYAKHEQETFEKVVQARNLAQSATGVEAQQAAENQLNKALVNLFALSEQYPELKANQNFLQLQEELSVIEQDIEKSRRYYNGTVREKNILVESFPSSIVANMFGFVKSKFFELDSEVERSVPQVKF